MSPSRLATRSRVRGTRSQAQLAALASPYEALRREGLDHMSEPEQTSLHIRRAAEGLKIELWLAPDDVVLLCGGHDVFLPEGRFGFHLTNLSLVDRARTDDAVQLHIRQLEP